MREALRRFARQSEEVTRRHGLTARSYTLLLMIKTGRETGGGATPDELEQRLQLAKSTVTELVQRAVDAGLVRRELHPSRRGAILIRLTPKGDRQLNRAFAQLQGEREHLRELLTEINRPLTRRQDAS